MDNLRKLNLKLMLDKRFPVCYSGDTMNKIPTEKRTQILKMLVEGSSMRSISRVVGVSINTVNKILVDAGEACDAYHDEHVRGIAAKNIQADEQWAFCYAKDKTLNRKVVQSPPNIAGSVWTWTALDADTRLIISWLVSPGRYAEYADEFMEDLASRVVGRPQIVTDGYRAYTEAVEKAFGSGVDYAQLVKKYENNRYTGADKTAMLGNPNMNLVNTSYVERHNLTTRMSLRRFTRRTNAHSKRMAQHCHALAMYFVWYNFCRIHTTLTTTPALAAGVADEVYDLEWIGELMDERAPEPKRTPYGFQARTWGKILADYEAYKLSLGT